MRISPTPSVIMPTLLATSNATYLKCSYQCIEFSVVSGIVECRSTLLLTEIHNR